MQNTIRIGEACVKPLATAVIASKTISRTLYKPSRGLMLTGAELTALQDQIQIEAADNFGLCDFHVACKGGLIISLSAGSNGNHFRLRGLPWTQQAPLFICPKNEGM